MTQQNYIYGSVGNSFLKNAIKLRVRPPGESIKAVVSALAVFSMCSNWGVGPMAVGLSLLGWPDCPIVLSWKNRVHQVCSPK